MAAVQGQEAECERVPYCSTACEEELQGSDAPRVTIMFFLWWCHHVGQEKIYESSHLAKTQRVVKF
eukprot:2931255-Amphidinium_carterae.1